MSHTLSHVQSGGGAASLLPGAGRIACKDASLFEAFRAHGQHLRPATNREKLSVKILPPNPGESGILHVSCSDLYTLLPRTPATARARGGVSNKLITFTLLCDFQGIHESHQLN